MLVLDHVQVQPRADLIKSTASHVPHSYLSQKPKDFDFAEADRQNLGFQMLQEDGLEGGPWPGLLWEGHPGSRSACMRQASGAGGGGCAQGDRLSGGVLPADSSDRRPLVSPVSVASGRVCPCAGIHTVSGCVCIALVPGIWPCSL